MSTLNDHPPKTTVSRITLFILTGFATSTPLFIFEFFWGAGWSIGFMPFIILAVLFFMFVREKRFSTVKPGVLEIIYSTIGAFYPSILAAIGLWVVWWISFGVVGLFLGEWDIDGSAYDTASFFYSLFSLGFTIFLVRLNWRHLANQLYPPIGTQSAFAKLSASGKRWLFKRAIQLAVTFVIFSVVTIIVVGLFLSPGEDLTIGDEFLIGLFFVAIYMFFVTISAWLWLRKADIPYGVEVTNKAIARLLQPLGFDVKTLAAIKHEPAHGGILSDQLTASVDLVARKQETSLVIDVMTLEETVQPPDWITASEFHTATGYLQRTLQLPSPIEAVLFLVDVPADDTLFAFAESQDIKVIQLSNEAVVELLTQDVHEERLRETAATIFSPLLLSSELAVRNGGQHG